MTKEQVLNLAGKYSIAPAQKYGADPAELAIALTGIAKVESNFNPDAKNKSSTARGLMQILICTQREIEYKRIKIDPAPSMYSCKYYPKAPQTSADNDKIFDPEYSMFLAAYELAYQYKRYKKNWQTAIHAYNQGSFPGARKADGQGYANKVVSITKTINPEFKANFLANFKDNRVEFY